MKTKEGAALLAKDLKVTYSKYKLSNLSVFIIMAFITLFYFIFIH